VKAIEKYLERCNYAKQLKLEQELLEAQKLGGGNKNNPLKATKGKAPSFMRKQPSQ
jgi:hypothetical protein